MAAVSRTARRSRTPAAEEPDSRTTRAAAPVSRERLSHRLFFYHELLHDWPMCFWEFSRCVGQGLAMRPVWCALQFGRMLLGRQQCAVCLERFSSQGLLDKQRKNAEATLMAHVLRIFICHVGLWWSGQGECGGEGFCLVGACTGAWHMCCHHCLFICSRRCHLCNREFVLWFLAQGMYRTCGSSLLVANSSLWEMAFPRVSGLALQLLG